MKPITTPYRCRACGAATYRRVVHRGPDGAMTYSGLYRCSGCDRTFSDPAAWWDELAPKPRSTETGEPPASSMAG